MGPYQEQTDEAFFGGEYGPQSSSAPGCGQRIPTAGAEHSVPGIAVLRSLSA